MKSPVSIYIVHHPKCEEAATLAKELFRWFRLGYLSGDSSAAGLPVYFRRDLFSSKVRPAIEFNEANQNVVVLLVDHQMVGDESWRFAINNLVKDVDKENRKRKKKRVLLLPVALHGSFYRTDSLYQKFNPIRLLDLTADEMLATVRRATTEATARMVRSTNANSVEPLQVFLSHAKRDGTGIAECIRDGIRKFGQMEAWYDANNLPLGASWENRMEAAAKKDTAAMVTVVTDAYPTRPWCRREALLTRTPVPIDRRKCQIWKIQPVVAVHQPRENWVRGIPMLEGVPRAGWEEGCKLEHIERIVDRLALEVLLNNVHRQVAKQLEKSETATTNNKTCYVTWVPDAWSLTAIRHAMIHLKKDPNKIKRIVYPGYGLTHTEIAELDPFVKCFNAEAELVSFEEAWK